MARKTHEEASGFVVTPLLPKSSSTGDRPDITKKRKRKEEVVAASTESKEQKHGEKSSKEEKKKRKEKQATEGTTDGSKEADTLEVSEKTAKQNKKIKGEDSSPAVDERQTDNNAAAGESVQKKKKMRHRSKAESTEGGGTSGVQRVKGKVAKGGLSKYEKEALRRRTRREAVREKKMVCYLCRGMGHSIKFCPKATEQEKQTVSGICYKCGSTAHKSSECRKLVDPKAGITTLGTIDLKQGGDDDDVFVALHKMQGDKEQATEPTKPDTRKASKKKVVTF
ncbi:hypothetical protein SpCBS45565_g05825 [Spizellomyces sp. 'palustris']|nr:hypothetical protein SpCBS45565_g05825 [Spizellomyces sp. 'palustris']